jgi:hypothetical protein
MPKKILREHQRVSPKTTQSSGWFRRIHRGSSLIEIIIATGIVAMVMTSVVSVIAVSVRNTAQAKGKAIAAKYSQEGMEFFRQQRQFLGFDGFNSVLLAKVFPVTLCLASIPDSNGFRVLANSPCGSGQFVDSKQQFQRSAVITRTGSGTTTALNISVTTTWYEGSIQRTNNLSQVFKKYQLTDAISPSQFPIPSPPTPPYVATVQVTSADLAGNPGNFAVDGNYTTFWNSGGMAPQWIRVNLGQPRTISKIRLVQNHWPPGSSTHRVWASNSSDYSGGFGSVVANFSGASQPGTVFQQVFPTPITAQYLTVETTVSNSWISWFEVEAFP